MAGNTADTVLLLHCDGADASTTFADDSVGGNGGSGHTVTAVNDAQVDTAQSKFGGASLLLDGSGDYLSIADHADFDFGSGAFGVDWWEYRTATGNRVAISRMLGATIDAYMLGYVSGAGDVQCYFSGNGSSWLTWGDLGTYSTGTWIHRAVVRRAAGDIYCYQDGVHQATLSPGAASLHDSSNGLYIGAGYGTAYIGNIDEVRVVKGACPIDDSDDPLYIASGTATDGFSVPTEAYAFNAFGSTGISTIRAHHVQTCASGLDASRHASRMTATGADASRNRRVQYRAAGVDATRYMRRMLTGGADIPRDHERMQAGGADAKRDQSVYWGDAGLDAKRNHARPSASAMDATRHERRMFAGALDADRDHERMMGGGLDADRRRFTADGWHVYAVDVSTGAETYLGFIDAADSPLQITGASLTDDATYRIEARPAGRFWPECRTRRAYALRLESGGAVATTSGLPVAEGLDATVGAAGTRIVWRAAASAGRTATQWAVWFSGSSPVDTSGAPDATLDYSAEREAVVTRIQSASEYVAVAARDAGGDKGEVSELALPWDSTAPGRPQGQRASPRGEEE